MDEVADDRWQPPVVPNQWIASMSLAALARNWWAGNSLPNLTFSNGVLELSYKSLTANYHYDEEKQMVSPPLLENNLC